MNRATLLPILILLLGCSTPKQAPNSGKQGILTGGQNTAQILSDTILPDLPFRDAVTIYDALRYVELHVSEQNPQSNIQIVANLKLPNIPRKYTDKELLALRQNTPAAIPRSKRVSALDAIKFVTELTGLTYSIEGDRVIVSIITSTN